MLFASLGKVVNLYLFYLWGNRIEQFMQTNFPDSNSFGIKTKMHTFLANMNFFFCHLSLNPNPNRNQRIFLCSWLWDFVYYIALLIDFQLIPLLIILFYFILWLLQGGLKFQRTKHECKKK